MRFGCYEFSRVFRIHFHASFPHFMFKLRARVGSTNPFNAHSVLDSDGKGGDFNISEMLLLKRNIIPFKLSWIFFLLLFRSAFSCESRRSHKEWKMLQLADNLFVLLATCQSMKNDYVAHFSPFPSSHAQPCAAFYCTHVCSKSCGKWIKVVNTFSIDFPQDALECCAESLKRVRNEFFMVCRHETCRLPLRRSGKGSQIGLRAATFIEQDERGKTFLLPPFSFVPLTAGTRALSPLRAESRSSYQEERRKSNSFQRKPKTNIIFHHRIKTF